ncbi:NUDIX hydrolase [Spongiactinospora sp. TRM90649]|uniref:NUDIX hydrolase n=1 Tax=Spongiactinospora sp. TRM90649 TaxID=3031114 RepID=UPI0023F754A2|nr:NUDIX hydrolase [Spongiactinospora sp. TRM90649]MDF5758775.1 NUDIX hydrolase [Spongiactinospora sp. TRM90649]
MTRQSDAPAVAAAIIVRRGKVLLIRRRVAEGELLWTFPGGQVELGESGEQAAVRETREEVGLDVTAVKALGARIHPATGRRMIYVVCETVAGTARVADVEEVAEVEWCGRTRVAELVPFSFFAPVQAHLDEHLT